MHAEPWDSLGRQRKETTVGQTQRHGDLLSAILPSLGVILKHADLTPHLAMADASIYRPLHKPWVDHIFFQLRFIFLGSQSLSCKMWALTGTKAVTRGRDPHGVPRHIFPFSGSWLACIFEPWVSPLSLQKTPPLPKPARIDLCYLETKQTNLLISVHGITVFELICIVSNM